MKIATILDQIDLGIMALPEFQRGYVWNRDQVRGLMDSLYRLHPVGGLLVWVTKTDAVSTRGNGSAPGGSVELLLDGQQRITSLYGIIRGKPPKFFDGNAATFTGLFFNLADETFEFYGPAKMRGNPLWINVTDLMQQQVGDVIQRIMAIPELVPELTTYITRLTNIQRILGIELHIERVTGDDKTVDVVVDIFNWVNSGGTKLSKGDLALAKICAAWPEARDEMKADLAKWRQAGFHFKLDWYLRCVNALVTGEAMFSALATVNTATFQAGLGRTEKRVDSLLNLISSRLGLDHNDVLGSRYSLPLLVRYLEHRGGSVMGHRERDKMLYWYVHTFLWGRYGGSTESALNQDLALIEDPDGALDRLIERLQRNRGDLRLRSGDFAGWSRGARFYPLLYMLTRVSHSRDLATGIELRHHLLGNLSSLQMHHIFPKALLYKHNFSTPEANALANFTFLTQETNLLVSDRDPVEYLAKFEAANPGVLASHWIPTDPELWQVERYRDFLATRRELLAQASNDFLDSLVAGEMSEETTATPVLERPVAVVPGGVTSENEQLVLVKCNEWVVQQGLPEGEFSYELTDPESGEPIAVLDLAWPLGLQEGLSSAVAMLIDEGEEAEAAANQAGFRYFSDPDAFRTYVRSDILALDTAAI